MGGGAEPIFGRPHRGGVSPDSTNMDKGREGVKNPEIFADVLNGSPLRVCVVNNQSTPVHWPAFCKGCLP